MGRDRTSWISGVVVMHVWKSCLMIINHANQIVPRYHLKVSEDLEVPSGGGWIVLIICMYS